MSGKPCLRRQFINPGRRKCYLIATYASKHLYMCRSFLKFCFSNLFCFTLLLHECCMLWKSSFFVSAALTMYADTWMSCKTRGQLLHIRQHLEFALNVSLQIPFGDPIHEVRASLAIYHLISNVRSWNNC